VAITIQNQGDHPVYSRALANIGLDKKTIQFVGGHITSLGIPLGNYHPGAFASHGARDCEANSTPPSGDNCDPVLQFHGLVLLSILSSLQTGCSQWLHPV
jgi:hypothetical protein